MTYILSDNIKLSYGTDYVPNDSLVKDIKISA